jgi:secreted trypsin-like serine protease
VLTAAHCLYDQNKNLFPANQIRVVLGEHNYSQQEGSEQQKNVVQVIPHPGYQPGSGHDNDIGLLKLASPAQLNDRVKLVPLLASPIHDSMVEPGKLATVSGWGATSEGGSSPTVLMKVSVPVVSNRSCNSVYGDITDNMLCAGYREGGKDSCQGDSGGPLVVPNGSGGWLQAGVVSFGRGCARPDVPGVYARVSRYLTRCWRQVVCLAMPEQDPDLNLLDSKAPRLPKCGIARNAFPLNFHLPASSPTSATEAGRCGWSARC